MYEKVYTYIIYEFNKIENTFNVVVLDACRDNPFGWSRSGTRGLSIVSRQPADSIIVYATSAGARASDGDGRNGLFTSQLINNLATPGLEVKEVFNRTGQDVAIASSNSQIPAIYSQFFGTAYLGETPVEFEGFIAFPPGTTVIIGGGERERDPAKFWSIGASIATGFTGSWLIGTLRGTVAPFKYFFLEPGVDIGFLSGEADVKYYSFFPYVHTAFYYPIIEKLAAYAGIGGGYMVANYSFDHVDLSKKGFAADAFAGINLFSMIDISYTFRTSFENSTSKVSLGYTYRF